MGTQIFLGKPPANIEQWIKAHAGPEPGPTAPDGKVLYRTTASGDWLQDDADITDGTFNGFANKYSAVEVIIPSKDASGNDVTSIGDSVFFECSNLMSVVIPDSVTSIGDSAFIECSGLTSVTIPNSVTSIGDSVFWGCSGLTSVTIPDSVTDIGSQAFSGTSLTNVTIPNSVMNIGSEAFYCSSLMSMTFSDKDMATVQGMENYSWDIYSGCVLHCTDGNITI